MQSRPFTPLSISRLLALSGSNMVLAGTLGLASAASFTPSSGDYNTAANWTTGAVPGSAGQNGQEVVINGGRTATFNSGVTLSTGNRLLLSVGAGDSGTLILDSGAGTLNFGGSPFNSANYVGVDGSTGALTINAGTINMTDAGGAGVGGHLHIGSNGGVSNGTVTVAGGALNVGTRITLGVGYPGGDLPNVVGNNGSGNGTLTLSSGTIAIGTGANGDADKGFLYLKSPSGGSGTAAVNLNGGTLSLVQFQAGAGGSNKTINFNGGTVQARANNANFLNAVGGLTANAGAGGAIFDTNGFNIGITQALVHDAALGGAPDGGLVKNGAGILTLSNAGNSFTGNVTINNGTVIAAAIGSGVTSTLGIANTARTITVNAGGTLQFNAHDTFGAAASNPVLSVHVNGGTITNGPASFGQAFTTFGPVSLAGGTITSTGGANAGFQAFHFKGTVTSSGNSLLNTTGTPASFNGFHLGNNAFDVTGGTLTVSAPLLNAAGGGATGFTKSGAGTMVLTAANGYTGNTFVNGGTLEVNGGTISATGRIDIGLDAATPANFTLTAGSVTIGGQFVIGGHGSTGTAAINGGTLQVNAPIYIGGYGEGTGTGTITQTAGTVTTTAQVNLGGGGPNNGVYNLNGGTLTTPSIVKSGSGTATFNFNGGILRSAVSTGTFLQGLTAANLQAGGAIIDTNGFDIAIAQQLLDGGGNGGLVKNGAGSLTLTNTGSSFTGNLSVNSGTLVASGAGGGVTSVLGAANVARTIAVNNGATLRFGNNDTLGNDATATPVTMTINQGGLVTSGGFYTTLPNLILNGGELRADGGANAGFPAYQLRNVNVGGTTPSAITATAAANSQITLGQTGGDIATFNVADVTGSPSADLTVSARLLNSSRGSLVTGLTKSGAGTMVLSAANGYTGPTTVNGGTLALQGAFASPSFAIASGSVLELNVPGGQNDYASTTFSGSGTLRKTGAGEAIWQSSQAIFALDSGSLIDVQQGLFTGGSFANEVWTNNKSNLNVEAGATFSGVEANVRVNALTGGGTITSGYPGAGYAQFTFGVDNGSGTFNGILANQAAAGNFVKEGTGTQTLAGNNTYTGATTINGGKLILRGGSNSSSYNISSGTALEFDVAGGTRDLPSASFNGAGTLRQTGAGTLQWGGSAATFNLGSGSLIDVQGGTFVGGSSANENWVNNRSNLNVAAGASFNGVEANVRVNALTGDGTIRSGYPGAGYSRFTFGVDNGSGTFNGVLVNQAAPGNFVKEGAGTQTLTGANSYTGATTVSGGTLALQNTYASPSFTVAPGAALELNVSAGTRDSASTSFNGAGSLRKTGAGTLFWGGSAATFNLGSGSQIDVQGGTFVGGSSANENWVNNKSNLNVAAGAVFDGVEANVRVNALTGAGEIRSGYPGAGYSRFTFGVDNGSGTFDGVLRNSASPGSFVKEGTGTQTLTGASTYTGSTTIAGGRLIVSSASGSIASSSSVTVAPGGTLGGTGRVSNIALQNSGTVAPGLSPGILFGQSLVWDGGGLMAFELSGSDPLLPASMSDMLDLDSSGGSGAFTKGASGAYRFDFMGSSPFGTGAAPGVYTLVDYLSTNFSASDFSFTNLNGYGTFQLTSVGGGPGSLQFIAIPEPGRAALLGMAGLLLLRRRRRK